MLWNLSMVRALKWLHPTLTGLSFLALLLYIVSAGETEIPVSDLLVQLFAYLLILIFLTYVVLEVIVHPHILERLELRLLDFAILAPLFLTKGEPRISAALIILRQFSVLMYRVLHQQRVREYLDTMQQYPARLLAGSFLVLIVGGTILLALPFASESTTGIGLVDALFTATSATCVTGLIVVDTASQFSVFGEVVILILIQLGGLGIMALSASAAALLGKRLAASQRVMMQALFEQSDYEELKKIIFYIIRFTFVSEIIGALVLSIRFAPQHENLLEAAYYGLFHSISAFCNAGFALWSDSLSQFADDPVVNITICTLIILGGIGFTVVGPLLTLPRFFLKHRKQATHFLSIHSQIVLTMTGLLLFVSTLFFLFLEYGHAFQGLDFSGKLWASLFHATTARTAGFNTVDLTSFQTSSLFFFTLLMFIGASPGSTGGGIKTTTLATLALTALSMITKRSDVEFRSRRIPPQVITKAISIFTLTLVVIPLWVLTLLITEDAPFMEVLFEVISAFGTVGLSLGLTSKLTLWGKISITLLMFIGRLGPLTVALVAGEGTRTASFRYPKGELMVG